MATKEADKQSKEAGKTAAASALTCPECGKTFTRAASLGAHRQKAHGVAGSSKSRATPARSARRGKVGGSGSSSGRRTGRSATVTGQRRQTATSKQSNGRSEQVNRDALLKSLFPAGIPPREDVISAVNSWLNEAERLARLR
jgi:hypothetical protein